MPQPTRGVATPPRRNVIMSPHHPEKYKLNQGSQRIFPPSCSPARRRASDGMPARAIKALRIHWNQGALLLNSLSKLPCFKVTYRFRPKRQQEHNCRRWLGSGSRRPEGCPVPFLAGKSNPCQIGRAHV